LNIFSFAKLSIFFFIVFISDFIYATCNFRTGEYVEELLLPNSIKLLEIDIPKSKKFVKNFFDIMTHVSQKDDDLIPVELKKYFKANISIYYEFGKCSYKAKVRQNGDYKDHISFKNGAPIRSLMVKLIDGNILNATQFKILIPETRGNLQEIFGTTLLRAKNFITPETFQIKTSVNGVESEMLFQEHQRKELIERNGRREAPIIEGDEVFYFTNKELRPLLLSRLVNKKWLMKGRSSLKVSLRAFEEMQNAYIYNQYTDNNIPYYSVILNHNRNLSYQEYFFIISALNAKHGLGKNNRRHFYDMLKMEFEPIYYDGIVQADKPLFFLPEEYYAKNLSESFINHIEKKINNSINRQNLRKEFLKRVIFKKKEASIFFDKAFNSFLNNQDKLLSYIKNIRFIQPDSINHQKFYKALQKEALEKYGFKQILFTDISPLGDKFSVLDSEGRENILTKKELSILLSKNLYKNNRAVLVQKNNDGISKQYQTKKLISDKQQIHLNYSKDLIIEIDTNKRIINFNQKNLDDWVLIKNSYIKNWTINFNGLVAPFGPETNQRFNEFGLTGCLTIYNSVLEESNFKISNTSCEDGLNIISSSGNINSIDIHNSSFDGLDIDFSNIHLKNINISNSGNDCLDVSYGEYKIDLAKMKLCRDKALSIGESSRLNSSELIIDGAKIGISSKDSSISEFLNTDINTVDLCFESMQKKQEFGGSKITFDSLYCDGKYFIDNNSIAIIGETSLIK